MLSLIHICGDACPLPVVKAKKAISELKGAGEVEVLASTFSIIIVGLHQYFTVI